jgi:hypothetical protein
LQTHRLVAHPDHPPLAVKAVSLRWVELEDGRTMLRYRLDGCGNLVIPPYSGTGRADHLWKNTCFELFLGDGSPAYFEFNFSPSGRWASYGFSSYRGDPVEPELSAQPEIRIEQGTEIFLLTAYLASNDVAGASRLGVNAVIEEEGGRISYWALAHPEGKPDFHDPACFVAKPL